jgi:hypothetical protein
MKKSELLYRIERLEKRVSELEENTKGSVTPESTPWPFPPLNGNMLCPHCGRDSGWASVLCMVIPAEGLRCMSCGEICIYGGTITYSDWSTHTHPQFNIETKPTPSSVTCGCEGCGGYHGCEEPFPSNERLPN